MNSYNKIYFQYKKLYASYLTKITLILNDYHKTKFDQNYWEAIIGIYLRRFILNYIFFDKISKGKKTFKIAKSKDFYFYKNYSQFTDYINLTKFNHKHFFEFQIKANHRYYIIKKLNFLSGLKNSIYFFFTKSFN